MNRKQWKASLPIQTRVDAKNLIRVQSLPPPYRNLTPKEWVMLALSHTKPVFVLAVDVAQLHPN
jgi:hypothetical protein